MPRTCKVGDPNRKDLGRAVGGKKLHIHSTPAKKKSALKELTTPKVSPIRTRCAPRDDDSGTSYQDSDVTYISVERLVSTLGASQFNSTESQEETHLRNNYTQDSEDIRYDSDSDPGITHLPQLKRREALPYRNRTRPRTGRQDPGDTDVPRPLHVRFSQIKKVLAEHKGTLSHSPDDYPFYEQEFWQDNLLSTPGKSKANASQVDNLLNVLNECKDTHCEQEESDCSSSVDVPRNKKGENTNKNNNNTQVETSIPCKTELNIKNETDFAFSEQFNLNIDNIGIGTTDKPNALKIPFCNPHTQRNIIQDIHCEDPKSNGSINCETEAVNSINLEECENQKTNATYIIYRNEYPSHTPEPNHKEQDSTQENREDVSIDGCSVKISHSEFTCLVSPGIYEPPPGTEILMDDSYNLNVCSDVTQYSEQQVSSDNTIRTCDILVSRISDTWLYNRQQHWRALVHTRGQDWNSITRTDNLQSTILSSDMESSSSTTSDGTGSGFDPIPIVGMTEKDIIWPGEGKKAFQPYKGQLKLSVYVNYGLLTIHVIQARHLAAKLKPYSDAYVKVCMLPDETSRTVCKTETILDTNNPLFDEKFSFELLEDDKKRRLMVSVWHRSNSRQTSDEHLGSMSFGIKHVFSEKKTINGWYYLLSQELGKRKHLQATTKPPHLRERIYNNIPSVNQDVMWMDPYTLSLHKGNKGYGFTVTGSCPVQISRVEPGTPADLSGLRKDDYIVKVDGRNVSRSTSDSVAKVIKNTTKQMVLEIQRQQSMTSFQEISESSWKPTCSSTPMASTDRHHGNHQYPTQSFYGINNPIPPPPVSVYGQDNPVSHPHAYGLDNPVSHPRVYGLDNPVPPPPVHENYHSMPHHPIYGTVGMNPPQEHGIYDRVHPVLPNMASHPQCNCGKDTKPHKTGGLQYQNPNICNIKDNKKNSAGVRNENPPVGPTHAYPDHHRYAGVLMGSPEVKKRPTFITGPGLGENGVEIWIDDPWTLARAAKASGVMTATLPRPQRKVSFKDF